MTPEELLAEFNDLEDEYEIDAPWMGGYQVQELEEIPFHPEELSSLVESEPPGEPIPEGDVSELASEEPPAPGGSKEPLP